METQETKTPEENKTEVPTPKKPMPRWMKIAGLISLGIAAGAAVVLGIMSKGSSA